MTIRVRIDGTFYDVTFTGAVEIGPGPGGHIYFTAFSDDCEMRIRHSDDQTPIAPKCQGCGRDLVPVPGWPGFGGCPDCIRDRREPNIFGSNVVIQNPRTCFKLEGFK